MTCSHPIRRKSANYRAFPACQHPRSTNSPTIETLLTSRPRDSQITRLDCPTLSTSRNPAVNEAPAQWPAFPASPIRPLLLLLLPPVLWKARIMRGTARKWRASPAIGAPIAVPPRNLSRLEQLSPRRVTGACARDCGAELSLPLTNFSRGALTSLDNGAVSALVHFHYAKPRVIAFRGEGRGVLF